MAKKQVFTCNDLPKRCFRFFQEIGSESTLCDVTIHARDATTAAHSIILGAAIPYFRDLFFNNSGEKIEAVDLTNIEPDPLKCLIDYAYSYEISIDANNVKDLLSTAYFLSIDEVTEACFDFLSDDLEAENVWETRELAIHFKCEKLLANVDYYIRENFDGVSQTKDFLDYPLAYLKELIEKDDLNVVNEEQVFDAVLRWVKAFPEEREKELPELLCSIRLPVLDPLYLVNIVQTEEIIRTSIPCRDIIDEGKNYTLISQVRDKGCRFETRPRRNKFASSEQIDNPFIYVLRASENFSIQSFDLLKGTWMTKDFKAIGMLSGSAVSFQNQMYFFQGCVALKYDPRDGIGKEEKILSMPTPRGGIGAAVLKEKIYVCGGVTEEVDHCNVVECFYPEKHEWATASSMLTSRCEPNVVSLGEYIFALGGTNSGGMLTSMERYDPKRDKWTSLSSMLTERYCAAAASLDGRIYVCGGDVYGTAEMYNPSENNWVFISSMNSARYNFTLLSLQGKLCAIRGANEKNEHLDTMDVYDPENDGWTCIPVPIEKFTSSAVVMQGFEV